MTEQISLPANTPGTEYVFPAYWGGVTRSQTPPMIHDKLRQLRLEVGGIAAKKQQGGPMFPVRGAKELAQKLAQALVDLNMVAHVHSQVVTHIDTDKIPQNQTSSGKPVFRTLTHVKSTVHIGAEDGSFVAVEGSGHGGDGEDKAGGKADTYAWKAAVLKGLCIPEQDMIDTDDEQPAEVAERPKSAKFTPPTKPAEPTPLKRETPESSSALEATLNRIAIATAADLEAIKDEIKSGAIALAGADKLRASSAFVKRSKELKEGAPNA